jgi:hypothetical protein
MRGYFVVFIVMPPLSILHIVQLFFRSGATLFCFYFEQ